MTSYTDISHALPDLMNAVLHDGDEVGSRNGRVKELLHQHIVLTEPWRREVLTPERKASLPAQIAETMWVLSGRDDIGWLSHYLPRAPDYSDDGTTWSGAYGKRLRAWPRGTDVIDQLAWVVDLLRKDHLTRRAVMTIYDPARDSQDGLLDVPCNDIIQFQSRLGKLHCHVFIRSNDLLWGFSNINHFEWSALQEIVAGLLGIGIGELHFSISSLHLYQNHWAKAQRISDSAYLMANPTAESPRFDTAYDDCSHDPLEAFDELVDEWFDLETALRRGNYGKIVINEINTFPEPMLQSWLRVIAWHWSGDESFLNPLKGTPLEIAARLSPVRGVEHIHPLAVSPATQAALDELQAFTGWKLGAPTRIIYSGTVPQVHSSLIVRCPTCESPDPKKHPAMQFEGEVQPCPDPWHSAWKDQLVWDMSPMPLHDPFTEFVVKLHAEKHAVYGDSWKRRGEKIGILANIARKIDRLGVAGAGDTSADTVIDLLVYLVKYRLWLTDEYDAPLSVAHPYEQGKLLSDMVAPVTEMLGALPRVTAAPGNVRPQIDMLKSAFEKLEHSTVMGKFQLVEHMIPQATAVARRLWLDEREGARIDAWQAGNATRSWNPDA